MKNTTISLRRKVLFTIAILTIPILLYCGLSTYIMKQKISTHVQDIMSDASIYRATLKLNSLLQDQFFSMNNILITDNIISVKEFSDLQAQFEKDTQYTNMIMAALTWGSDSFIFKNEENRAYYDLWINERLYQNYDLSDLPQHITQVCGEMSIYFQGFAKYTRRALELKKSLLIDPTLRLKNPKINEEILQSYKKAKSFYITILSTLENLNQLSAEYSSIVQKEKKLEVNQQLLDLLTLGLLLFISAILFAWLFLRRIFLKPIQALSQYTYKLAKNQKIETAPNFNIDEFDKLIACYTETHKRVMNLISSKEIFQSFFNYLPVMALITTEDIVSEMNVKFKETYKKFKSLSIAHVLKEFGIEKSDISYILHNPGIPVEVYLQSESDVQFLRITSFVIHDKCNQKLFLVEDLTQHKLKEIELTEDKKNAEKASASKSKFFSRVSHELRTPLNAIIGFSQTLALNSQEMSEKNKNQAEMISQAGHYLLGLVNDLLDLTKAENQALDCELSSLDLYPIVTDTIQFMASTSYKKANITNENITESHNVVFGNKLRLTQSLVNIINYISSVSEDEQQPSITFRIKKQGSGQVILHIICNDIYIKNAQEDMMFEPFSDEPLSYDKKDSQISLSIAKHLIELMGGKISIQLNENATIFEINLMSAKNNSQEEKTKPPIPQSLQNHDLSKYKILYIEDNLMNIELMKSMLSSRNNINLHISTTAEEGLSFLSNTKPDMIFLDINLPNMSGHELINILKNNHTMENIPIIGISASAMEEDILKAKESGFNDYITKPIHANEIYKTLNTYLH